MSLPATVFSSIPDLLRTLVQNGLVVGILLAMILENVISWEKLKE
jgi:xanthine/uracil permease